MFSPCKLTLLECQLTLHPIDLFQSFQLTFSTDNIFVVPLNDFGFLQPSPQRGFVDFRYVGVKDRSILKLFANYIQTRFVEISAAPKHQSDPELLLAIANNRIAIQEPDWVRMPYLAFRRRETTVDLSRKYVAYFLVA